MLVRPELGFGWVPTGEATISSGIARERLIRLAIAARAARLQDGRYLISREWLETLAREISAA